MIGKNTPEFWLNLKEVMISEDVDVRVTDVNDVTDPVRFAIDEIICDELVEDSHCWSFRERQQLYSCIAIRCDVRKKLSTPARKIADYLHIIS